MLGFKLSIVATDFNLTAYVSENGVYAAMDWLIGRQPFIEKKLASRYLDNDLIAFYDRREESFYVT